MVIINRYMPDVFISSIDLVYLCKICVKICKVTLPPICVLLVLYLLACDPGTGGCLWSCSY